MPQEQQKQTRKLPKSLRLANLVYKVIMSFLAGLSLIFATMTDMHDVYYQVVSVFSSAFPVIWTQILDACKQYESERTPTPSPDAPDSPASIDRRPPSTHDNLQSV